MVKTTIYVDEDLKLEITRAARDRGVSEAELIRGAIAADVTREHRRPPTFPILASRNGPDSSDLSERVDEMLADTGFGER